MEEKVERETERERERLTFSHHREKKKIDGKTGER